MSGRKRNETDYQKRKTGGGILYPMSDDQLGNLLSAVCRKLSDRRETILEQNQKDLQLARSNGMSSLRLQRLALTPAELGGIFGACRKTYFSTGRCLQHPNDSFALLQGCRFFAERGAVKRSNQGLYQTSKYAKINRYEK